MEKTSITWVVLFAVIFLIGISCNIVSAQPSGKAHGHCAADIDKFCKGMSRGDGGIARCLKEHESELSPECKAKKIELKKKVLEMREDCKADVDKFCNDTKPGAGRIIKCLKSHEAELNPACKANITRHNKP